MGSLSNLYISQSFTSLLHLGNDGPVTDLAPGEYTQFQDGLGNSLGISVNSSGDISSSGYIYATNIFPTITTSSFNQYTASTNVRLNNLETTTASLNSSVTQLNASSASQQVSINALNQFTASQSTASINTSITNLNQFSASTLISINNINSTTASLLVETENLELFTASANIRLNNLESTSASVNISISNLNSTTASQGTSISNLNTSASLALTTASLSGQTLTFTKGNGSTFGIILPDVSGSDITALNQFTASQLLINTGYNTFTSSANSRLNNIETTTASLLIETQNLELFSASALVSISNLNVSSASQQVSINALNVFTASQSTASIVTSITNLNQFTSSANSRLNNIETTTASLLVETSNLEIFSASALVSISNLNASSASQQISINSINAATSSYITESETASFARTNVDNNFTANQTFTNITAVSASFTYVQTLFETASVIYSSGSNQFGDELSDIQTLSGSVKVQGSLTVNGTPVLTSSADVTGFVTTSSFNAYTQSNDQRVSSLESNSASVNISINNLNSTTASLNSSVTQLNANTASQQVSIDALNVFTASQSTASLVTSINNLNTFTQSAIVRLDNLESTSASVNIAISNLNSATSSYVTETESGSFLLTASFDNGTRNLTFTKGDNTTFAVNIPDISGSAGDFVTTSSFNSYTSSTDSRLTNIELTTASLLVETQNLELFSASALISINSLNGKTGSYATTGSNSFVGVQTINSIPGTGVGEVYLLSESGSLVIGNSTATPTYAALAHITSSQINANTNLIFKTNNNTGTTIVSGSANIFTNPAAPAAGRINYIGGSSNLFLNSQQQILPTITGSGATASGNTPFMNGNIITGPQSVNINQAPNTGLHTYNNNILNGSGTWTVNATGNTGPVTITGNLGVNSNITLNSPSRSVAQINAGESGSNSVSLQTNTIQGTFNYNGPVSSSAHTFTQNSIVGLTTWNLQSGSRGLNFQQNIVNGGITYNDNTVFSPTLGSSNTINTNNINGTFTVNQRASSSVVLTGNNLNTWTLSNDYDASSVTNAAARSLIMTGNALFGTVSNNVYVSGSSGAVSAGKSFNNNLFAGQFISASTVANGTDASMIATIGAGNDLHIVGTSRRDATFLNGAGATIGSAFFGRYNKTGQGFNTTAEVIFAVGTGTSGSAGITRKTGFLIDSGSNSYFEGTVNVSGSLLVNGISLGASGLLSSSVTNFVDYSASVDSRINGIVVGTGFATTGSNSFNGNQIITGSMTSSLDIVVSGIKMGFGNPAGTSSIAIGSNTLVNNTATANIAIGAGSMQFTSASAAASNVAIGASTLTRNQVDSQIAIGANALERVTTGNANTAIGRLALSNTTTGFDNLALGTNSLLSNTTGERNIAIGKESLRNAAVNASYNVGIGYAALYDTKERNNVAIGHSAFNQLQSGSQNTAIGYLTGYNVLNGNNNTLIGGDLRGQSDWSSVVAISNGSGDTGIKFFNSGSKTTITNDTLISGSLTTTGSLTIQSGSSFFANGNRQFNVGAFQSDVTQSGSANVSQSMNFEVTDISSGVSIVSNSQITLVNSGTYNIQFSAQIDRVSGSGTDTIHIWLKKNGTNVSASAGAVTISGGAAAAKTIAAWNYVVDAVANDYYELCWESTDNRIQLINQAAGGNIPSTPSIILTVTQVR